jgi:hypothetical protein
MFHIHRVGVYMDDTPRKALGIHKVQLARAYFFMNICVILNSTEKLNIFTEDLPVSNEPF